MNMNLKLAGAAIAAIAAATSVNAMAAVSAEEAARLFPKNANVTAAVALAGIGFNDTHVALIADPTATSNSHQVDAQGTFGEFTICLRNEQGSQTAIPLSFGLRYGRCASLSDSE